MKDRKQNSSPPVALLLLCQETLDRKELEELSRSSSWWNFCSGAPSCPTRTLVTGPRGPGDMESTVTLFLLSGRGGGQCSLSSRPDAQPKLHGTLDHGARQTWGLSQSVGNRSLLQSTDFSLNSSFTVKKPGAQGSFVLHTIRHF